MNWKAFFRTLAHAAIGGAAAGIATVPGSGPITLKTALFPVLASAATSVVSLFAASPTTKP